MRVDGRRHDRREAPEAGADGSDRNAAREQVRRVRAAQVVEAAGPDLRPLPERLEGARRRLRAEKAAELAAEDQVVIGAGVACERPLDRLPLPVLAKRLDLRPLEAERPVASCGLTGRQRAASAGRHYLLERCDLLVEASPRQAEQFAMNDGSSSRPSPIPQLRDAARVGSC